MSRQEEISPFLHRDYKYVANYAAAFNAQADRDRRDRLKAKMLCERLLHKKWGRTGALDVRLIQRLGDYGRNGEWAFWLSMAFVAMWALAVLF